MKHVTKPLKRQVRKSKKPSTAPSNVSYLNLVKHSGNPASARAFAEEAQRIFVNADRGEANLLQLSIHIDRLRRSKEPSDIGARIWLLAFRKATRRATDAHIALAAVAWQYAKYLADAEQANG